MWPLPDNHYIRQMLDSRGEDEQALRKEVKQAIVQVRWSLAVYPWLRLPKYIGARIMTLFGSIKQVLTLEFLRDGRYRETSSQVHGGADQASSGGTGGAGPNYAALQATTSAAFFAARVHIGIIPLPAGWPTVTGTVSQSLSMGYAFDESVAVVEDAGIKAGEIVGYRCWRLVDGFLYSCYQEQVLWEPGKIVEGDTSSGEGVHAFKDRLAMGAYGHRYSGNGTDIVSGTVHLWGDVVEHERGYRASKAAIASIDDSPHYDARALRRKYGLVKKRGKKK